MPDPEVRRVVPLTYGWAEVPQTISIHGGDPAVRLREPVPGVLLQVDGGWLLLDTGFNVPLVRDPPLYRRFHGRTDSIHAELLADPRDSLEVAFETVGIDPDDVVGVALSHLHYDHAGGLRWFAERVPIHLQRRELEYGLRGGRPGDGPEQHGFIRVDYDDPAIDWRLADGDADLAPGVVAVPTYGQPQDTRASWSRCRRRRPRPMASPASSWPSTPQICNGTSTKNCPSEGSSTARPSKRSRPSAA